MAEERAQRRLTTILAADVVGYSRLMERNEAGTMARLRVRRHEVLMPSVTQHGGHDPVLAHRARICQERASKQGR